MNKMRIFFHSDNQFLKLRFHCNLIIVLYRRNSITGRKKNGRSIWNDIKRFSNRIMQRQIAFYCSCLFTYYKIWYNWFGQIVFGIFYKFLKFIELVSGLSLGSRSDRCKNQSRQIERISNSNFLSKLFSHSLTNSIYHRKKTFWTFWGF